MVIGTAYVTCKVLFMSDSLSPVWGHWVHFAKFPMVTYRKHVFGAKYRLLLFLAICQILKLYGTMKISYLSYIASIHKLCLFHLAKGQAEPQGPWASFVVHLPHLCSKQCSF